MTNKQASRLNNHFFMGRLGELAAALAGILYTLAFAPFDYAYCAPLALIILFLSWHHISPKRALLRGYLFGLGAFGLGVSWVYVSVHDFGGNSIFIAGLMTLLFVAFWSLFPALAGYGTKKIFPKQYTVTGFASIWLLVEYWRGQMTLDGFPWLLSAYSQLQTPLSGYIALTGVYGTGFLLVLSASIVVSVGLNRQQLFPAAAMLALIWATGAFLKNISWTHAIGSPIKVSLIQGSVTQDKKWRPEFRQNTLRFYQAMTEAHWDSAVIVWPETAVPAYLEDVYDDFLAPLDQAAQNHRSDLVISVPVHGRSPDEKYNAVITLGREKGIYRKTHLLPFGEYLPWQPLSDLILSRLNLHLGHFTPGAIDQPLLRAGGYPFATSICYEDVFGDIAIRNMPNAAFLVNVTNDGWFGDSTEPHQHLQIARMRAIETGRFLLRATNTGITAIINPDGDIVDQAPLFKEAVLTGSITPMGGMSPYAQWGDKPVIALVLVLLTGTIIHRHSSPKS